MDQFIIIINIIQYQQTLADGSQQLDNMKWMNYIVLLFTAQFFAGMTHVYSISKKGIENQLSLSEDFFGIIEMLSMLGRFLSTLYLIFVPSRPNLTYFLCCFIQVFSYCILASAHLLPQTAQAIFIIGLVLLGLGRGIYIFPFLLLHQTFNQPEDVLAVNIWVGLAGLGGVYGYLIGSWVMNTLQWNWIFGILIYSAIYLITGILTYMIIPQIEVNKKKQNSDEMQQQNGEQNSISQIMGTIKGFYRKRISNILLLFDYAFQENQIFIMIFWLPFYFMELGYGVDSTLIALSYPVCVVVGSFTIIPIFSQFTNQMPIITSILVFLEFACFFSLLFVGTEEDDKVAYIIFLSLGSYFLSFPYSRVASNQFTNRVQNEKQKYLAINFMRLIRQVLTALSLLLVGYLIKEKTRNYLYILIINSGIVFLIHITRRIVEGFQVQQQDGRQQLKEQEQQQQEMK